MGANGQSPPANVPIIPLAGVNIAIGHVAGDPKQKAMVIGPIMLMIPIDEPVRKAIVTGLTGVQIAQPGDVL
jgi:hypothetical protein